jgi:cold shock protein
MKPFKILATALAFFILSSCGEKTDVVESGVYQGTVDEVEADKSEIYVKTGDGKLLELYFTDKTVLTKDGQTVNFSELAEGKKVEVEVKKEGKRLDPVSVKILE